MAKLESIIKSEITRLAKREVRSTFIPLRKEVWGWYHRWTQTGEPEFKQRILDYNEDDCGAMRALVDRIRRMLSGPMGGGAFGKP